MRADQWEAVWRVLGACWPQAAGARDQVVKIEWARAFDGCEPKRLVAAIRELAREAEWPSIASLTAAYDLATARLEQQERLKGLPAGPAGWVSFEMPDFDAAYDALDPVYRQGTEERLATRYPGAFAGRESDPNLRWAWRCLVVTAEERGDPGEPEGDAVWRANLQAAQRQVSHELHCPRCRSYAEPPAVPTKANPARDRMGSPCVAGELFWAAHWAAGMERPVA